MRDLGTVRPGSTIYIPFDSFGANGESLTLTGLATTDIKIYKNGGTTERASQAGFTLLDTDGIDFDGLTGIHGVSINLADNTTADFYTAGASYRVVIDSVTINSQTVRFTAATFRIGYAHAVLNTTIATVNNQASLVLTDGPAEDEALTGMSVIFHDISSAVQFARGSITAYVGSTKTITLLAAPTFTVAVGDNVSVLGADPRWECRQAIVEELVSTTIDLNTLRDELLAILDLGRSSTVDEGTITATTTVFAGLSALSSSDDFYNGAVVAFRTGSLKGLARKISDYDGSDRQLTVDPAFPTAPSDSDEFTILGRIE